MTIYRRLLCLASLTLFACSGCATATTGPDTLDSGPGRDSSTLDSGPERCDGVDRSCPSELPGLSARCEGELACPYPVLQSCGGGDDSARCVDGRWSYAGFCLPGPVLYEACREPEDGPFPGVAFTVPPPTSITWGPQGGAMIDVRFTLTPPEDAPRCAQVRIATTFDGESVELTHAVRVPCGRDVLIQTILPSAPCDARLYPYSLDVEVVGVGTQHVEGELMGGPPPFGPSPCAFSTDAGMPDGGS